MSQTHFEVHQPTSLAQALEMLSAHRSSVRVLAGGTDLVPKLKAGVLGAAHLVSLGLIPGLDAVSFTEETGLVIGPRVRLSQVGANPQARRHYPGLAHACSVMATTQIRNMGTVTGNLANAAPSGDTAAPLLVYDAVLEIVGPEGRRQVPVAEFFRGPGMSVLEPVEIIEAVKLPCPPRPVGSSYQRLSARGKVDIAAVGVAGLLALDARGKVARCRLALAAVAPTPIRCAEAEAMLEGQIPGDDLLARAAEACRAAARPIDDVRATAVYRKQMVQVLALRVLEECRAQAQGGVA